MAAVARRPHGDGVRAGAAACSSAIGLLDSLHYREALADSRARRRAALLGRGAEPYSTLLVGRCARRRKKPIPRRSRRSSIAKETVERAGGKRCATIRACNTAARISAMPARAGCRISPAAACVGLAQGLAASLLLFGVLAGWQARRTRASLGEWLTAWGEGRLELAGRTLLGIAGAAADAVVGVLRASGAGLPRLRHRQGRAGRALPVAEKHPHRAGDRHADHPGDAAVRAAASASRRAISAAGWTMSSSMSTPR